MIPFLLLAAVLLASVESLRVASVSMEPTLTAGDHVLVDRLTARWHSPGVGDLVVFRDPERHDLVVKRVVALEGQTVALEDAVLFVEGEARHEPQVDLSRIDSTYFGPVTVPPNAVFVLGDNRAESIDSRNYGSIRVDDLVGRVVLTF
ncbi:signal peptidase I [Knoellia sp. S7-12]|uniref:signal peptidase I n=1 Tax=Knoellia sp. S7-12 TaxID=3126698 RepID=UPI003369590D